MHAVGPLPVFAQRDDPAPRAASAPRSAEPGILLAILVAALLVSGMAPKDGATWILETAPILVGVPILIATRRRFPLTALVYRLLFLHAILLTVGAHHTFSEVPAGLAVRDALDLSRNHFDRVVHFFGGLGPALLAREILRRKAGLRPGAWLFWLVTFSCLAGSAFYELLEWWVAAAIGADASAFLATQGDPWDTQWDMFLGLSGALVGQVLFSRRHEKELRELRRTASMGGSMNVFAAMTGRFIGRDVALPAPPARRTQAQSSRFRTVRGVEPAPRARHLDAPPHWLALAQAP
jgi:putative membrane protein